MSVSISIPVPKLHDLAVVRSRLLSAGEKDQRLRMQWQETGKADTDEWKRIDAENQVLLKEIIAIHGWPKRSLVGEQAENYAWLIAQHADLPFIQKVFDMRAVLPATEIMPGTQGIMEDRILVYSGKPQKYGTQFRGSPEGNYSVHPIEGIDMDRLLNGDKLQMELMESRRKSAGLPSFKEELALYKIPVRQLTGKQVGGE